MSGLGNIYPGGGQVGSSGSTGQQALYMSILFPSATVDPLLLLNNPVFESWIQDTTPIDTSFSAFSKYILNTRFALSIFFDRVNVLDDIVLTISVSGGMPFVNTNPSLTAFDTPIVISGQGVGISAIFQWAAVIPDGTYVVTLDAVCGGNNVSQSFTIVISGEPSGSGGNSSGSSYYGGKGLGANFL